MAANVPQGVPDTGSGTLAQIQAQIRAEQMQRIKELGTAKMIGATAPADAMNAALGSYQKQKQLTSEEDLRNNQIAQAQEATAGLHIRNQAAQAEEDFQEAPNAADPTKSNRETLLGSQMDTAALDRKTAQLKLDEEPADHKAHIDLSNAQIQTAHDQGAAARYSTSSAKTQADMAEFRSAVQGYATDPATRDAKTAQLSQEIASRGNTNPDSLAGEQKLIYTQVDQQKAANALGSQQAFYQGPNGYQIQPLTKNALSDVNSLQSGVQQRNQYQRNLHVPGVEVNLNQKGPATDARNNFADMMDEMGATEQAKDLREDFNTTSVSDKMNAFLGNAIPQAQQKWNTVTKAQIKPEYSDPRSPTYDGYVKNVDNAWQGLNTAYAGSNVSGTKNIRTVGQGAQATGTSTGGSSQYTNPQNPGGATAAPAQPVPSAAPSYGILPEAQ